jgi:hypothetical protein
MHHPRFFLVPHSPSFWRKMNAGFGMLESLIAQM